MSRLLNPTQQFLHRIIEGTDTPAGRTFDMVLILAIILSVLVVMLDSVASLNRQYGSYF